MDLAEISPNLKIFAGNCSIFRFGQVSSGFGEKTLQLTRSFQVLEAEIRCRPSPTSDQPILGPDRTGWLGGSSLDCCWTPLNKRQWM